MSQRALPRRLAPFSLLALVAGAAHAQDWPTHLATPGRVAASTGAALEGAAPYWEIDTMAEGQPSPYLPRVDFAPAVAGDVAVIAGFDMTLGTALLTAYDVDTGTPLWQVPVDAGLVYHAPTIAQGKVIIGVSGATPKVQARDLANGSLVWSYSVAATFGVVTSPVVVGDTVVVTAETANGDFMLRQDRHLVTLALDPGVTELAPEDAPVRQLIAHSEGGGVVAVEGDRAYAAGFDRKTWRGYVRAFDLATGALAWEAAEAGDNGYLSAPVVAGGRVFVGNVSGFVDAFDTASGDRVWHAPVGSGSSVNGAMAYADGVLYAWSHDGIFALDGANGAERWSYDWPDYGTSITSDARGIAFAGGVLYAFVDTEYEVKTSATSVLVQSGDLLAIDSASGALLWTSEIGRADMGTGAVPALGDGFMLLTTLELRDGVGSFRLASLGAAAGGGLCTDELAVCQNGLAACQSSAGTCSGDLAACRTTSATCQATLTTCETTRSACEDDLAQCEAAKADLDTELEASMDAEAACQDELGLCQDTRDGLSSALGDCETAKTGCATDLLASEAAGQACVGDLAVAETAAELCAADLVATEGELRTTEGELAAAQGALTTCQGDLTSCQTGSGTLETEVTAALNGLRDHFRKVFRDPSFELPGHTAAEQLENLVQAIESLPGNQTMLLYRTLGGRPNPR